MGCSASSLEKDDLPTTDQEESRILSPIKADVHQRDLYQLTEAVEDPSNESINSIKEAEETLSAHSYPLTETKNKTSKPSTPSKLSKESVVTS